MINEKLIWKVVKMLYERKKFYEERGAVASASAYGSAHDILLYALDGNEECLNQFDYFGKD